MLKKGDHSLQSYGRMVQLSKASKQAKVTLYFFSARNVLFFSKVVKGMILNLETDIWEEMYFPFPDVLYDRLATRDKNSLSEKVRRAFDSRNIKKINSISYFNKGEIYTNLCNNEKINQYLPETKLFSKARTLFQFLKRHPKVYLKAVRSGRGYGVLCVEKTDFGGYYYRYFRGGELFTGKVINFLGLYDVIRQFFQNRVFIMQKAIDLMQIDHCNIDFRAEVQRNGEGELVISGITARTGVPNSPITTHSTAYIMEDFLEKVLDYSIEEIQKTMERCKNFLFDMYTAIEEVYGHFGEIGIDFSLDTNGDIWFIEPNAKSAKVSLYKAYDEATYFKAFLNPLEYAKLIMNTK